MVGRLCRLGCLAIGLAVAWPVDTGWAQRLHVIPEGPLSPEEQLEKFHLPPGFEIELVASEPEIANPLNLSFDHHGRLWVTDTVDGVQLIAPAYVSEKPGY